MIPSDRVGEGEWRSIDCGRGKGGADSSSHLRWIRASFSRSINVFSPPARKESLITSMEGSLAEDVAGTVGAGDSDLEGDITEFSWGLRNDVSDAPQSSQFGIEG